MAEHIEKENVRCNECKHLHIVKGNIVYAVCEKTRVIFERYKIDPKEHTCEYGEVKSNERNTF